MIWNIKIYIIEIKDIEHGTGLISKRNYREPEVILNCCDRNKKVDIWSVWCVLMVFFYRLIFISNSFVQRRKKSKII